MKRDSLPIVSASDDSAAALAQAAQANYWRGLEELEGPRAGTAAADTPPGEFAEGMSELEVSGHNRRDFMNLLGASMALAGVGLAGCVRKPKEKIFPYSVRPEHLVPGKPRHYASVAMSGDSAVGVVVESFDGRPTKLEGNPSHPMSLGAASTWLQASVLDVYDPHRSRLPAQGGSASTWDAFFAAMKAKFGSGQLDGVAILTERRPSPTLLGLLAEAEQRGAKVYEWSAASTGNAEAGAASVGVRDVRPLYAFDRAKVVASFDGDFLGTEGDAIRNARLFSKARRVKSGADPMNRLYAVEPTFSIAGMMADHRLRVPASQVGQILAHLASVLIARGASAPGAQALAAPLAAHTTSHKKFVDALAKDLLASKGESIVVVGERQSPRVHALGMLVNALLGNLGATITLLPATRHASAQGIVELAAALKAKSVKTLVILGGNPVYDAPADLAFGDLLAAVPTSVHLSSHMDETSKRATWHVPRSHALEAWGDLRSTDGTLSVQQPLIAPLYDTISEIELLAAIVGRADRSGYGLVRQQWASVARADADWNRAVHDGLWKGKAPAPQTPSPNFDGLAAAWAKASPAPSADRLELAFHIDPCLFDGRYGTNPWLQELPDPVTKITWDNAVLMSPSTAKALGVKTHDKVELEVAGRKLKAAAYVTPGVAAHTLVLPLGYGRTAGGKIAEKKGFNASRLRTTQSMWIAHGVTLKKLGGRYHIATTQMHHTMVEPLTGKKRHVVRANSLTGWKADPRFADKLEIMERGKIKSFLWTEPNERKGQQWGLSIDLSSCTGCNACTIACQAENNIPVVGKKRVIQGREMHWIRLDRYFDGDAEDPQAVFQPMACQQCETAPCESVCPVAATSHSPDGLNDMAYNRCIGTRYCSNNCPYKVRRFNFFNFNLENDGAMPLLSMQRNPDVTVRFRGVMEKCTYCVQRISRARIDAKVAGGDGTIRDGAVTPACAQTCPTEAIVFGDINDPKSRVSEQKRQTRDYAVLAELNVKPRTTYLAKIRNPNPELA
jgi:molybdopterin-containing oxidoreductase family iron-sulfur binding subunit